MLACKWVYGSGRVGGREVSIVNAKPAIGTGSAGGIGRATAVMLAARGAAEVALVDVNEAGLVETARLVEAAGARASVHRLDLSDVAATEDRKSTRLNYRH